MPDRFPQMYTAEPDVTGVALGTVERPDEYPSIRPTPSSLGGTLLGALESLLTVGQYNPIQEMREAETPGEAIGHLPNLLMLAGLAGFGAKKVAGAGARKVTGELVTRAIDPFQADFTTKASNVMELIKKNPKAFFTKYEKPSIGRAIKSDDLAKYGGSYAGYHLLHDFAFRKAFNLTPLKGASNLLTRTGERTYALKEPIRANWKVVQDIIDPHLADHPLFGAYDKTVTAALTHRGHPSLKIHYRDRWDWDWNPGEFKEEFDALKRRVMQPAKEIPNMPTSVTDALKSEEVKNKAAYMLERTFASKIAKPITFEGTLGPETVWSRGIRGQETGGMGNILQYAIQGRLTKPPSKKWLQAMQHRINISPDLRQQMKYPHTISGTGRSPKGKDRWDEFLASIGYMKIIDKKSLHVHGPRYKIVKIKNATSK